MQNSIFFINFGPFKNSSNTLIAFFMGRFVKTFKIRFSFHNKVMFSCVFQIFSSDDALEIWQLNIVAGDWTRRIRRIGRYNELSFLLFRYWNYRLATRHFGQSKQTSAFSSLNFDSVGLTAMAAKSINKHIRKLICSSYLLKLFLNIPFILIYITYILMSACVMDI